MRTADQSLFSPFPLLFSIPYDSLAFTNHHHIPLSSSSSSSSTSQLSGHPQLWVFLALPHHHHPHHHPLLFRPPFPSFLYVRTPSSSGSASLVLLPMRLLPLSNGGYYYYYYFNNTPQSSLHLLQAILPFHLPFQPKLIPRWVRAHSTTPTPTPTPTPNKSKLVVILGATGTGKSRLSIDLATRLPFPCEVINSDKMQVYKGLDITTNKIPMLDRRSVPHHLLGFSDPHRDFTASEYRSIAASTISSISSRRRLPLLVGGSNSFIHALLTERFNPESVISNELRYNCCFLRVDLSFGVLCDYLRVRVDDMFKIGMLEELAEFYDPDEADSDVGIRKAIGVPELDRYFRRFPPRRRKVQDVHRERERKRALEEAVEEIKENTCELAKIQMGKILRLRSAGWDLRRLDATEAFRAVLAKDTGKWAEVWERNVVGPCVKIVNRFLEE